MFPYPDWSQLGTKEAIESSIRDGLECKEGWFESKTDTLLIVRVESDSELFRVHAWNRLGIKDELRKLLALPLYITFLPNKGCSHETCYDPIDYV